MKTSERIFELIEKEEMTGILNDNVLLGRFRELMESDLLSLDNDKVVITSRGQGLRNSGRRWYPQRLWEDELAESWMRGREQLRLLRNSSLLVLSSWLLVFLYIFHYCLMLCSF